MNKRELVKEILLNDMEYTKRMIREINSINDELDFLNYYENDEEFFNENFNTPMEAVRATFYGDYAYYDEYVKINAYGNLESKDEYELEIEIKSYIDDIIDQLLKVHDQLYLSNELEELFDNELIENE